MTLALYVLGLVALLIHAPPIASVPHAQAFAAVLGALTAWHVGWSAFHFGRAMVYRRRRFPALRRASAALDPSPARPAHLYLLVSPLAVRSETTARVFQGAIDEVLRFDGPATLVACPAEAAEQRLIKQVFHRLAPPDRVRLIFVRWAARGGHGSALASGLRAIIRARPAGDAAVVVLAGDTLLPSGTIERSLSALQLRPDADLVLTDEAGIGGRGWTGAWLALSRAQRHQMMSSMALAGAPDFPIGGVMIFRAALLGLGSIVELIGGEAGRRGPPRLEELICLELLRAGRRMLYLPDVAVVRVDGRAGSFAAGRTLIRRACQIRLEIAQRLAGTASNPAASLVRIRLLEARVSGALALLGLLAALGVASIVKVSFLWGYILWVGTVRLLQSLPLLDARPRIGGLWPLLDEYQRVMTGILLVRHLTSCLGRQSSKGPPEPSGRPADDAVAPSPAGGTFPGLAVAMLALSALVGELLGLPVAALAGTGP